MSPNYWIGRRAWSDSETTEKFGTT